MKTILLISPYWKEDHRWMVSSVKLAELWQRLGYRVVVACMGSKAQDGHLVGAPPADPPHPSGVASVAGPTRPATSRFSENKTVVSPTLTIYRKRDFFLPDPLNFGIALGFAGLVRRLIKEEKPDLVICNKVLFWTSFSVILLRLQGHRVLLLTDALVGITWQPRAFLPKIIMTVGGWTVGWLVLLCARRIVTFHPQPPRILKFLGVAGKTEVIPTGIDLTQYTPSSGSGQVSTPVTSRQSPVAITYIGRLESVKGVDDFLAAAVPLQKIFSDLRIRVVGWHTPDNVLVYRYNSTVEFTGLRSDIPEILGKTDMFVMPSYSEGLSNALMEAMASGCACIASDVGGNRYLIENGVSGLLFPPGDREALRSHIRRLIEDPAKRRMLGANARRRIEEKFSWDVVGGMYRDFLEANS